MQPGKRRRQILWRERRSKKTVQNHHNTDKQQRDLEECPRVAPMKKSTHARNPHQVEAGFVRKVELRVIGFRRQLFSFNSLHVDLSFQTLPVRERGMNQNHPVTRHPKFKLSLVASGRYLAGLGKDRCHTRMGHVTFQQEVGSNHWLRGGIFQIERDAGRADPNGPRCNFVRQCDTGRGPSLSTTSGPEQNGHSRD